MEPSPFSSIFWNISFRSADVANGAGSPSLTAKDQWFFRENFEAKIEEKTGLKNYNMCFRIQFGIHLRLLFGDVTDTKLRTYVWINLKGSIIIEVFGRPRGTLVYVLETNI